MLPMPQYIGITEAGSFCQDQLNSIGIETTWMGIAMSFFLVIQLTKLKLVMRFESLGLRYSVQIISCPSCARQGFDVISTVRNKERLSHIKTPMSLSIIGCGWSR